MSIERRRTRTGFVYDVRLRDPNGRPYKRTFRTKREAVAFDSREAADRQRGAWVDPRKADTTFGELAQLWMASNPGKRPGTFARDESVVRVHLMPALGSRPVGSITPADVQRLVTEWSRQRAPRTVHRNYSVLRAILNHAVDHDLIARTPCRRINLPAIEPEERPVLTPDQVADLAAALGPDYAPMAYLGALLGLRWGECSGLRVGAIDWLRGTLVVREQATRGIRGAMITGAPKSNAGRRTQAVPGPLMDMLRDHMRARGLTGADHDALLFVAPDGGPLDYSHFRARTWLPATKAAGLEGVRFHDLRKTNATALVVEGVDVRTAQARLGHSDPRLTLAVYAQATTEADRAAAERLGVHFFATERGRRTQANGPG